ncbi:carboxymuconolactone decarboxylase family protein [Halorarius halobius]|uniref:carboxymuconolactone decarboxylase family protein n=1 Tax=Halorarius halobius TaxID=2962671 RepID=UPI0020CC12C5|nr:carboxymuconolactone decarboxylase family protein [Halorarius halobius]
MTAERKSLSGEQRDLKQQFVDQRGHWSPALEHLLSLDPGFIEGYLELANYTIDEGALDRKTKAFLLLSLDAATTHLYRPGIRTRINDAFDAGASVEEIVTVLEVASVLGVHAITTGAKTLADISGFPERSAAEAEAMDAQKREYEERVGFWSERLDAIVEYDDTFFDRWLGYFGHPLTENPLTTKQVELIYVAIDVSTTHLYDEGLELHIEKALEEGATQAEIMEVFELASLMSAQTTFEGIPILVEEAQKRGKLQDFELPEAIDGAERER